MRKKIGSALVVGSGISGIRSSLDLAEQGYHVTLIDRAPHLGGVLSQLDYQFPTDHCGMCRMLPLVERDAASQYCLRKGLFHENIDILLSTELAGVEGEPGKFTVTLKRKPTLVDATRCMGCGECSRVCPVEVPDAFNAGLTLRKAVYLPVPHSIPNAYVVDVAACTLCGECERVCPTGAIDFGMESRSRFRILVVDDELIVRDSLKEWLQDEGFQVDMAASGAEALEVLGAAEYHLMLLDIKMPGMDGVEVLKQARERHPELPVVMMTAYATVETAVEAMKFGALDYLMKPFDPDTLVPMMVQLFQRIEGADEHRLEVGSIVLAAGFETYDPASGRNTYGYGVLPNVLTSIEFERLISGTGPRRGRLLRPSDGGEIRRIAWLQCVGSREPQADADFCSSACCMFSVKEALLVKEKSNGAVETTIFYMDMRTHGKGFQRYRDRAEKERGVRFVRSRVHSVEQDGRADSLRIVYADQSGQRQEEDFDLVVLAAGQRPPAGAGELAEKLEVPLDPQGFCQPTGFSPSRTSQPGIFLGGSFSGMRDISDSVIQASAASLCASRFIHSKGGGLAEQPLQLPPDRDVSRELPRLAVAVCTCGGTLQTAETLCSWLGEQRSVARVKRVEQLCTREGWQELEAALEDKRINRVLIGACMPYAYTGKVRQLARTLRLPASMIDVVDVRTPSCSASQEDKEPRYEAARAVLGMGIGRLRGMDPMPLPSVRVTQRALVVGGGLAGMTAALAIAEHGFPVSLIEKEPELGGNLRSLHWTLEGNAPQELLRELVQKVEKQPHIEVHLNARVLDSQGRVGRFVTVVEKGDGGGETIDHGVTVLATGGREAATENYGYGQSAAVMTQHDLEEKLAAGELDPAQVGSVAMIQCVDSREEPRNYCSRICCASALKNALHLKELKPDIDIWVFYRDFMAYGFQESHFTRARQSGVVFVPYALDSKPEVALDKGKPQVKALEPTLGRTLELRPDLLVLSTGIVPEVDRSLDRVFGVVRDQDGFFQEADSKWRPVDCIKEGVFLCGLAHSPRSITESMATAEAAAQRAMRILNSERLAAGSLVAQVRHSLCSLCERCIDACPYGAREYDEELERVTVDEIMCQGCGSCAAVCPNSASFLRGYRDQQVFEVLDAALEAI